MHIIALHAEPEFTTTAACLSLYAPAVSVLQSPGATATATKKAAYRSTLVKAERKPEVVTLTEGDLQRMLADAPIMTAEQASSMRHAAEERKEAERAAAKARKEKMLRLEEEARKQVRSSTVLPLAGKPV
jgi:hypothetical protein